MGWKITETIILALWLSMQAIAAQEITLPPCDDRPHSLDQPWIRTGSACIESVIDDPSLGTLAFTALSVGNDGTLYATRPLEGQVIALRDSDGDLLPDAPTVLIDGLTLPNGLAFADGSLYIAGGTTLYRWANGELTQLVDDLPTNRAYWTGGVIVHDARVYVGIGAGCTSCSAESPQRGAVWSFALDGTDRRIEMAGLLQPSDLAFVDDQLIVTDTAQDALILSDGRRFSFAAQSHPSGIAWYSEDMLPHLAGQLLVVLSGSTHNVNLRGYTVASFDSTTQILRAIMPDQPVPGEAASNYTNEQMNLRGSGFFPHRPLDVAVSPDGWVYISITDGRILALRP